MNHLDLLNISKKFGKTPVVNGLNLNVKPGEFIVLVGPAALNISQGGVH